MLNISVILQVFTRIYIYFPVLGRKNPTLDSPLNVKQCRANAMSWIRVESTEWCVLTARCLYLVCRAYKI